MKSSGRLGCLVSLLDAARATARAEQFGLELCNQPFVYLNVLAWCVTSLLLLC